MRQACFAKGAFDGLGVVDFQRGGRVGRQLRFDFGDLLGSQRCSLSVIGLLLKPSWFHRAAAGIAYRALRQCAERGHAAIRGGDEAHVAARKKTLHGKLSKACAVRRCAELNLARRIQKMTLLSCDSRRAGVGGLKRTAADVKRRIRCAPRLTLPRCKPTWPSQLRDDASLLPAITPMVDVFARFLSERIGVHAT